MELATSPRIGPPSVELPIEIYAHIINSVVVDKYSPPKETLKALSLTHRALVGPCQKLLFWSVFYSERAARKLVEIHDTSPHLAGYVRQLYFFNHHRTDIEEGPTEFTVEFLSKFHNLSELILTFTESRRYMYDWKRLDPSVATALLTLLQSQSRLETLIISGIIGFPLQGILSLANCKHLKELIIFSVTIDFTDVAQTSGFEASNTIATGHRRLASFSFGTGTAGTHDTLLLLTGSPDSPAKNHPILDFSSIESLSVEWKHSSDLAWTKLLMQSSPYLRTFNLTLSKGSRMSFEGLAAAVLGGPAQTINSIRLRSSGRNNDEPFCGLSHEFQQLSGNVNALENIDIYLTAYCSDPRTVIHETCTSIAQQSKAFDAILANRNAFPALRGLTVYIIVTTLDDLTFPPTALRSFELEFKQAATQVENGCFKEVQTILNLENFSFEFGMEWAGEWEFSA